MDSDPRGAVLIINNRRFANNHKERLGTEQDCRNLKLLFEELGFHVYVKEDLKSLVSHFGDFFYIPLPFPQAFVYKLLRDNKYVLEFSICPACL